MERTRGARRPGCRPNRPDLVGASARCHPVSRHGRHGAPEAPPGRVSPPPVETPKARATMEQLKDFLRLLIGHRFWIVVVIAAVLPALAYFLGSGPVKAMAEKEAQN